MRPHDPAHRPDEQSVNDVAPAPDSQGNTEQGSSKRRNRVLELLQIAGFAFFLALLIKIFVVQAFKIPTGSMEDTLLIGDLLLVNKLVYGARTPESIPFTDIRLKQYRLPSFRDPQPGDVIVFRHPHDPGSDWIKRCIAVAGQTVEIRNKEVFVDGQSFREICDPPGLKFADPDTIERGKGYEAVYPKHAGSRDNYGPVTVPEGTFFAMGDNRDRSYDSRHWGFVPLDHIIGEAIFVYWSTSSSNPLDIRWGRIGKVIR